MNSVASVIKRSGGADPESPWLGLQSFTEETQAYFFGRTAELQEIFERVLHKPLTILFGQSGLGKTSLIQAGLIPNLREAGLLPVSIRVRYDENAPLVGRQMIEALSDALTSTGREDLSAICLGASSLWLLLHDPDCGFIGENGSAVVRPVFIFDQFEEIFTLGEGRRHIAENFRETIATIVENRMPPEVRAQIESDDRLAEREDYRAHPAKVLLSLREDFLHLLERWRWQLPTLMDNRMELRPLSGVQAVQAVTEPGSLRPGKQRIVSLEVATAIVHFVAGVQPGVPLDELDAIPPLLSLMCAELNAQRLAVGEETIAAEQLEGRSQHILEKFYSNAFSNHPPAVREFVENRLLSDAGYRQAVTLDTAEAELARAGVSREGSMRAIIDLVERRLLLVEERGAVRRVELTHDILTPVALASRTARREREEGARFAARQRERLRKQRKIALAVVAVLLFGCASLTTYAFWARQEIKFRQLLDSGYLSLETRDYSSALQNFKEAARRNSSESSPWFGIGDTLVGQFYASGNSRNAPILAEAINAYNNAIEIEKRTKHSREQKGLGHSKLAEAYVGLGDVYAAGADPDFKKAEEFYKQAQQIDPESAKPPVGFGNILLGLGRFHDAIDQYKASLDLALRRNETDSGAHAGLGAAYFDLGRYRLAIEEFNRAIGARPNAIVPILQLANATYMNDRNDPHAGDLLKGLVGSDIGRLDSLARMNLAYLLLEKANLSADKSRLSEAVQYLQDAYQRDPYAFSCFRLGIGRALQGDAKEASKLWETAAKLSWGGGDPLGQRIYAPFLATLRGQPDAFSKMQEITRDLEHEGAVGLLEAVKREADLIQRSGLYDAQVTPVIAMLDGALNKAREVR
jgi:tetratricopeptide (TPR) repeat protein